LCYASLGSDTGGSIRYPSAACGLTGLKPTWGRVSRYGVYPLADSLDHIGPMARTAADCAAMLAPMAGWDENDATSLDTPVPDFLAALTPGLRDMRIGIDQAYAFDGVHPDVAEALETALDVLRDLGARIIDISLPPFKDLVAVWVRMCAIETAMAHQETYPSCAAEYGPDLAQLIDEGLATTGVQAAEGHVLRLAFSGAFKKVMDQVDCMICPTMPTPTPSLANMGDYGKDPEVLLAIMNYTAPFDFSGSPTVTLPNGRDANAMPLSMQFVGPHLGEANVLRAAHAFQSATDWHCAYPEL
ncbi:MAG: amidase, partial [Arenibacterium sp.]